MKKTLFLALLTTLLLLLAATTALAESPSDYNCPVCGEPCTEWYSFFSEDGTASLHSPACYICYTFVWDTVFICTPAEGTATCILPAVCSVCGSLDWAGSAPDPNAHGDMSRWFYTSPTQHYRYCLDCVAEASYEYEDHYGGTATCSERAICEGCGRGYGELSTEHAMSEWESISTTQHRKHCTLCWAVESIIYEDHYGGTATCWDLAVCEGCGDSYGDYDFDNHDWGDWEGFSASTHIRVCHDCDAEEEASHTGGDGSCFPICEVCGWNYLDNDGKHGEMSEWWYTNGTQHYRYCLVCGRGEEYAPHTGGTATCVMQAVCEGCGELYGKLAVNAHSWGEWTPNADGTHTRVCTLDPTHTETVDCTWGDWTHLTHIHHERRCTVCNGQDLGEHTGGTATCHSAPICDVCNESYGTPDSSGLTGHPNPVIEQKPATCYDEGYYRITCDHPDCTAPFTEIITPANGQHLYNHWDILGDHMHHTDCAVCGEYEDVDCTLWGMLNGETLLTVCPVCGDFGDTPFAILIAREDVAVPIGTLLVRGIEAPFADVLYGITVAGVYGGEVVSIHGEVTITLPIAVENFVLVRVDVTDGVETRTEIPFTMEDGQMTFSTDTAGLFLLIPAE